MRLALLFLTAGLAACSVKPSLPPVADAGLPARAAAAPTYLFVPELDSVYVYALGATHPAKTLALSAAVMLGDAKGRLYSASLIDIAHHQNPIAIEVSNSAGAPLYDLQDTHGAFNTWTMDRQGTLYLDTYDFPHDAHHWITAYHAGSGSAALRISGAGFPSAMAADALGNLYVAATPHYPSDPSNFSIAVYKPGATAPFRRIAQGLNLPLQLLFDARGYLYAVNWGAPSSISVYAPGGSAPAYTIGGVSCPCPAASYGGVLYVGNHNAGTIDVFPPGATSPAHQIAAGKGVRLLAFDPYGELYACCTNGAISVYRARAFRHAIHTFHPPAALVFAP